MTKTAKRSCVACRQVADKQSLLRFVRAADGQVSWDASGKAPGRGAYLCLDEKCLKRAAERQLFDRALRVKLSADDYQRLIRSATSGAGLDGHIENDSSNLCCNSIEEE
ncbi:MAG: YlxR family protein [Coriobacteriia bacterium]|nr:YlxR family protein [Coriobacteriia bacterium]